jgi:hypothetical protein
VNGDANHVPVENHPEGFAAHGDYEVDRKWLKKMRRWAAGTSAADAGEVLCNDAQIKEDSREQPRDATSLDLAKPDYLERLNVGRRHESYISFSPPCYHCAPHPSTLTISHPSTPLPAHASARAL